MHCSDLLKVFLFEEKRSRPRLPSGDNLEDGDSDNLSPLSKKNIKNAKEHYRICKKKTCLRSQIYIKLSLKIIETVENIP